MAPGTQRTRQGAAQQHLPLPLIVGVWHCRGLYRQRQQLIEPVFANTKFNRRFDRFHRRGRAAVRTEWRLIAATHNLLKLHRHQTAVA
jgi:hypothetical protein